VSTAVRARRRFVLGDYRLEPDRRLLSRKGEALHLARKPFLVLLYLIEHRDRLVPRDELLERYWEGHDVYDDALRKCVSSIRKVLGDGAEGSRFIETRWAEGYRYIGPCEEQLVENVPAVVEVERTRATKLVIEEELEEDDAAARQPVSAPVLEGSAGSNLRLPGGTWTVVAVLAVIALAGLATILGHRRVSAQPAWPSSLRAPAASIAVLPLENLTGDPSQEYFSEGLTDSLITRLSKIEGMKVISRSSALAFKGGQVDWRGLGDKLKVATFLEGSLSESTERVRVQVRLVSTRDGHVLWASQTYDRALKDIFAVEDEIVDSVAKSLKVVLAGSPALHDRRTDNVEAYRAYLEGRYYWNKRTADGLKRAIEHFERATELDPSYAQAYAGLADCYSLGVWYIPLPVSEALPKLKAAATRAVSLDEGLAEAHEAMANVASFEWRWSAMLREHERALELNPGYATAHHWYALGSALLGRIDKAEREIRRALELDPLSLVINTDAGWVLYLARNYDEAIEQYRKTLELDPDFTLAHFDLALAYSAVGRHDEAITEMQKAAGRGSDYLGGLGYVYGIGGKRTEAHHALQELKRLSIKQYVPPYHFAWIYTGLGDEENAIASLRRVYEQRATHVVDFKMHPMFDPLRADPRFQDLVQRVGLPD